MKTNTTIVKALAFAMLFATACNKNEIANDENTEKKGFALPVTVNVTRQGDDATKATYNESTKKLEFSAGDKLFVSGNDNSVGGAGWFAGTLTWQSGGTFSGTIYTELDYSGTADALFSAATPIFATLLPNGYESYNFLSINEQGTSEKYDDEAIASLNNAFVASETAKATGVEQFSFEKASNYSSGFALAPQCAILNFTISGFAASTQVAVVFTSNNGTVNENVTTDALGNATFALGVSGGEGLHNCTLSVAGNAITLVSSSKVLAAGKIYNITRCVNAINGQFSVSSTKQVYFSQGNLQATCASADADGSTQETWTWQFASNQYEVGTANSAINGNGSVSTAGTVDLFCWSTDATYYGISTITDNTGLQGAFVDWGGNIGSGWYTLSKEEWDYLFSGRTNAASKYGHGSVNGVNGMIILPDSWTLPDGLSFTSGISSWTNSYTTVQWSQMESAGAVFLPAAGIHIDTDVYAVGSTGLYWSSSVYEDNKGYAFRLSFDESFLVSSDNGDKSQGCSVRLVKDAN